jgi:hypothetical protein
MKKIALIGDIVASRNIKNRSGVQKKLSRLFLNLNKNNKALDSPYTITIGDEFQALYNSADSIFHDIWKILESLYPETVRFSIGIGNLTTRVNKNQALGMDGPAFHYARDGLNELKSSSVLFNIETGDEKEILLIKEVLSLISQNTIRWKHTRIKIFNMLNEGKSVKEISKKLHVTDKAVYKHIDAGALNILMDLFNQITFEINLRLKAR